MTSNQKWSKNISENVKYYGLPDNHIMIRVLLLIEFALRIRCQICNNIDPDIMAYTCVLTIIISTMFVRPTFTCRAR